MSQRQTSLISSVAAGAKMLVKVVDKGLKKKKKKKKQVQLSSDWSCEDVQAHSSYATE